jgi:hypothetical protein
MDERIMENVESIRTISMVNQIEMLVNKETATEHMNEAIFL